MIEVNLLPDRLRARSQPAAKKEPVLAPVPKAFPMGLGGLALLMGLLVVFSGSNMGAAERQSRSVEHQLKNAKAQAAEAERILEDLPKVTERYTVLATRLNGKVRWSDLLRVISLRCPEGVQISTLELERDRRSGRMLTLVIRGVYSGASSLEMHFTKGLQQSATFGEAFEAVIPEKELMSEDGTSFAISCVFRPFKDELVDDSNGALVR